METNISNSLWKTGIPAFDAKLMYNVKCLVMLDNGEITLLSYNPYHNVWDDEEGDDYYCKPERVVKYISIDEIALL